VSVESAESDAPNSNTEDSLRQAPRHVRLVKRQRISTGQRISIALETLAENHGRRVRYKNQSQVQMAISSFIADFGLGMDPDDRLKYVHYFMNKPIAAEAFNVLDSNTKVAFLSNLDLS